MNNTQQITFDPDEYRDYVSGLNEELLEKEKEAIKSELEDQEAKLKTNKNMIDKYIDEPGMEHLVEMSVLDVNNVPTYINIIKAKYTILEDVISYKLGNK